MFRGGFSPQIGLSLSLIAFSSSCNVISATTLVDRPRICQLPRTRSLGHRPSPLNLNSTLEITGPHTSKPNYHKDNRTFRPYNQNGKLLIQRIWSSHHKITYQKKKKKKREGFFFIFPSSNHDLKHT